MGTSGWDSACPVPTGPLSSLVHTILHPKIITFSPSPDSMLVNMHFLHQTQIITSPTVDTHNDPFLSPRAHQDPSAMPVLTNSPAVSHFSTTSPETSAPGLPHLTRPSLQSPITFTTLVSSAAETKYRSRENFQAKLKFWVTFSLL